MQQSRGIRVLGARMLDLEAVRSSDQEEEGDKPMRNLLSIFFSVAALAIVSPVNAQMYLPPTNPGATANTARSYGQDNKDWRAGTSNWRDERSQDNWRNNTWRDRTDNNDWRQNNWRKEFDGKKKDEGKAKGDAEDTTNNKGKSGDCGYSQKSASGSCQ